MKRRCHVYIDNEIFDKIRARNDNLSLIVNNLLVKAYGSEEQQQKPTEKQPKACYSCKELVSDYREFQKANSKAFAFCSDCLDAETKGGTSYEQTLIAAGWDEIV